jgi:S-adenosylmethionine:diacylglycerol 3-amino-3-carboxypropyl transferase
MSGVITLPKAAMNPTGPTRIDHAVRQNPLFSRAGLSERLFAHVFKGLVYPQRYPCPTSFARNG